MKTKLVSIGKILSIAIICLGVIHEIATFTPLIQDGLDGLSKSNFYTIIYMSLMCGASLILSGWLLIILLKNKEKYTFLSFPISLISIFILINGIASIIFMFSNPFAWIVFGRGLSITIITIKQRKELK